MRTLGRRAARETAAARIVSISPKKEKPSQKQGKTKRRRRRRRKMRKAIGLRDSSIFPIALPVCRVCSHNSTESKLAGELHVPRLFFQFEAQLCSTVVVPI